ncbi:O-antigen ligase family protein [Collimonas sp.]|uniref:O-antigen ligase family protein n=1 Tax=Collimonas sp. TaxID=1963772 RepID=UPI002C50C3D6|nr:O-antigen ligase family protein [Collimonas sp.]HWW07816.1 O-antigen ligase family protein [Collimonas sp.]
MPSVQGTNTSLAASRISIVSSRLSISVLIAFAAALGPLLHLDLVNGAGYHDNQRIIEIFCVVLSALFGSASLFMGYGEKRQQLFDRHLLFFLVLFFVLGIASAAIAYSTRYAMFEWANFLLLMIMSMIVATDIAAKGNALLDRVLLLCMSGVAVYVSITFIIYIAIFFIGSQPPNDALIFGYSNYRFFNHVQTITLPLLALFTIRCNSRKQKIFCWFVISAWWTLLLVSAGRGTFVGLLAGICVVAVYLRKDAFPWCRLMLFTALTGLVGYLFFYVLIPMALGLAPFGFLFSVVKRSIENPDSNRWELWTRAWEMIVAHPWLGAGPLHFAHFGRSIQNGAHPHNWILQIASEWGIPALLCLVAAIVLAIRKLLMVRQYLVSTDTQNHFALAAWLTIGIAILVDSLVSGLIVMPSSQLWIALYIGCAWGWSVSMTPAQTTGNVRLPVAVRLCGVIGALVLIYFVCNGLWPEIGDLPFYEEQSLQRDLYVNPVLRPRIWAGGYF